jgi:hypothetical protein
VPPGRKDGTPEADRLRACGLHDLIVLFNRKQVEVSFVFFSARISLLVLILLCVGIGFAAGYLFDQLRARRRS